MALLNRMDHAAAAQVSDEMAAIPDGEAHQAPLRLSCSAARLDERRRFASRRGCGCARALPGLSERRAYCVVSADRKR